MKILLAHIRFPLPKNNSYTRIFPCINYSSHNLTMAKAHTQRRPRNLLMAWAFRTLFSYMWKYLRLKFLIDISVYHKICTKQSTFVIWFLGKTKEKLTLENVQFMAVTLTEKSGHYSNGNDMEIVGESFCTNSTNLFRVAKQTGEIWLLAFGMFSGCLMNAFNFHLKASFSRVQYLPHTNKQAQTLHHFPNGREFTLCVSFCCFCTIIYDVLSESPIMHVKLLPSCGLTDCVYAYPFALAELFLLFALDLRCERNMNIETIKDLPLYLYTYWGSWKNSIHWKRNGRNKQRRKIKI